MRRGQAAITADPDKAAMAAEGMKIARELIDQYLAIADGIYLIPPFNRASTAVELIQYIQARAGLASGI
jgi:hypothetical protein